MPTKTRTSVPRRLLFSLVMLAIVLGTAEGLARLLGGEVVEQAASPLPVGEDGDTNLLGNPFLLYEMAPGERYEQDISIAINSFGLRGPEWGTDKPAGVRRVMALGDSSVYGFGVEDDEVFTARMDQALGDSVQVINSAVPGYSTYQTINLLQIRSLSLQPDLILIGCIWSDNNFDSFVDRELLAAYSSFRNRHARTLHGLLSSSALYTILDYKLRVLRTFPEERRVGWMVGRGEKIGERRVSIQEYAHNLETIVELAHAVAAEVAFMVLPNREDLTTTYESGAAWDPYRQVMRDTATRHGAPVMELPEHFIASDIDAEQLFLDEMHPTALGHRLWAELAVATLAEREWPSGGDLERDPRPGPVGSYEDPFVGQDHAPPPDADGQTGDPGEHDRQATASGRITGVVTVPDAYQGKPVQLDALLQSSGQPTILGTQRLSGGGSFELLLNELADRVVLIAYIDTNGDGPGPGDIRIDLFPEGLELPTDGLLEGLEIDLAAGSATETFAEGEQAPTPADAPAQPQQPREGGPIVTDQPSVQKESP